MVDQDESNSFKSFEEFLKVFCDFLSFAEQFGEAAGRFKQQIARLAGVVEEQPKYDISEIRWEAAQGSSGVYERSEDVNNPNFKALLKDVQAHGGKMTVGDYFVWIFKNGHVLGRKLRKALQAQRPTVSRKLES